MRKSTVITGQVFGTVDWVTDDKREIGMFIRTSGRQTRCILQGPVVEQFIANNQVAKGNLVTSFGDLNARVMKRASSKLEPELLLNAFKLDIEPPRTIRPRGALYAQLKSVVMYWEEKTLHMKSFLNSRDAGHADCVTCSVFMKSWVDGIEEEGRTSFVSNIAVGKEYTAMCNVETDVYVSNGKEVPVLRLLPTDFKLQG
ncbi:methionine synthase [Novimethylophilus kurashikiensis]|uniref:Methionine synthase n=1 Tax=Novimethylophilus kurashikiensis TaxID=1825523 RepID=A0A2R5F9R3_9PROT|nr:hypothetical protein [Novimethylophilus kurashikiensis]GBG14559.1 methionine synthase [Novimethylophilus kurashikiensis]